VTFPLNRLKPWTLSRSIWASHLQLCFGTKKEQRLFPSFASDDTIRFGNSGLSFKDAKLMKVTSGEFALPCLSNFLASPFSAFLAIKSLIRVGQIHRYNWNDPNYTKVVLAAALEATVNYINYSPACRILFEDYEEASIGFSSLKEGVFLVVSKAESDLWKLEHEVHSVDLNATLVFRSDESIFSTAVGEIDHMVAVGNGEIQLLGNIPLLEKFGYVSRIVRKELPSINE